MTLGQLAQDFKTRRDASLITSFGCTHYTLRANCSVKPQQVPQISRQYFSYCQIFVLDDANITFKDCFLGSDEVNFTADSQPRCFKDNLFCMFTDNLLVFSCGAVDIILSTPPPPPHPSRCFLNERKRPSILRP